jgi:hypothetical protein
LGEARNVYCGNLRERRQPARLDGFRSILAGRNIMALKPNPQTWSIKEQVIEDLPTGLTFQFEAMPGSDAPFRLRIFGNLPYGNREILFNAKGEEAGSGTLLAGLCKPSWLTQVDDEITA